MLAVDWKAAIRRWAEDYDQIASNTATTFLDPRGVAPSQLAVDRLTGPGREPPQGEEILEWMQENEDAWRT